MTGRQARGNQGARKRLCACARARNLLEHLLAMSSAFPRARGMPAIEIETAEPRDGFAASEAYRRRRPLFHHVI